MTDRDPTEAVLVAGMLFAGAAPARERRSYRRGRAHGFALAVAVCGLLYVLL
jgi:hypothetical protein